MSKQEDGVSLNSISHPVPTGWPRLKNRWIIFYRALTWPLRKHKVMETTEIEITETKGNGLHL